MTAQQQTSCDCGWSVNQKIVNGVETGVNEYPSVVGIIDMVYKEIVCGGTIISSRYVLSAAHCLDALKTGSISVLAGDHNVNIGTETPYSAVYKVTSVLKHPSYVSTAKGYDIALFKTDQEMVFSRGVGPICLPWNYASTSFVGYKVDILGWGSTSFSGPSSSVLRKVTLDIISNSDCSSILQVPITNTQSCTFTKNRDTCQKDSGAGLLLRYTRMYMLGIVSYGKPCYGTSPSVNTQIGPLLNWIKTNTPGELFCNKNIG